MYTDKKNILQLTALLKAHGIKRIVICPGSRNIPLVQTFTHVNEFTCYPMTDERSAGFFALGLALHDGQPVAVCCTSGTALVNLHPAVAEAYYQQVPLLIISADRPKAWIGQMDGQTLPQAGVFGTLVRKSVDLPEIHTDEDEWFCNRLINEAILELNHHGRGPAHINVPVSEPFFKVPVDQLPEVRVITRYQGLSMYDRDYEILIKRLNDYPRKMVIVGQMNLIYMFDKKYRRQLYHHFAWFTENLSNRTIPGIPIKNIEPLLCGMNAERKEAMRPDLLITYGGHIISKRLKKFLRKYKPKEHWHVSADGEIADLYGSLTTVIEMDPFEFLEKISRLIDGKPSDYPQQWMQLSEAVPKVDFGYSEMQAIGKVISRLPQPSSLHLANSSAVRYAQFFPINENIEVLSNRGTNGIEGSLSTAIGYAVVSPHLNFLIIGDLSFFYDMNALWKPNYGSNLRILLLNNEGGEIFQALPGLELTPEAHRYVIGTHHHTAKAWAEDCGFEYLAVSNEAELDAAIETFTQPSITRQPILMEVFTEKDKDIELLKKYFHALK